MSSRPIQLPTLQISHKLPVQALSPHRIRALSREPGPGNVKRVRAERGHQAGTRTRAKLRNIYSVLQ